MKKKIIALLLSVALVVALCACGKSKKTAPRPPKNNDSETYYCYKTSDSPKNEKGILKRTFYFANENSSAELTYNVISNFTMDDFYQNVSLITNDSYGYDRYMLVDIKGKELIPYDTYTSMARIGKTKYFEVNGDKKQELVRVINPDNKVIIDEKYTSVVEFPTEEKLFFLCKNPDGTYDVLKETGISVIENVPIDDIQKCSYKVSKFSADFTGVLILQCTDKVMVVSEKTGDVLIDNVRLINDNILYYYQKIDVGQESELLFLNNDATKLLSVNGEYTGCTIFPLEDEKYIINGDGLLVAACNNSGKITTNYTQEEKLIPIELATTNYAFIESKDKYVLKSPSGKDVGKYTKDKFTLVSYGEYGFCMEVADAGLNYYNFKGEVLFENIPKDSTDEEGKPIENATTISPVGKLLFQLTADESVVFSKPEDNICIISNTALNKFFVKDATGTLSEFEKDKVLSFNYDHGYLLVNTVDGVCNKKGEIIYKK